MRLINAEELPLKPCVPNVFTSRDYAFGWNDMLEIILKAKPVDAVHVVRCRDCAEDGRFTCPLAYIENNTLCFVDHSPDFFCAAGERKEGAE